MEIKTRDVGEIVVVEFHGNVMGGPDTERFRDVVETALSAGRLDMVLDMQHSGYMNSTGAGQITSGYVRYTRGGGTIKACNLSSRMQIVFDLVFQSIIEVYEDEAGAVAAFRRD